MQKKSVENIRDGGVNIADQMLKSSLKVLNKYTTEFDRSMLDNNRSSSPSKKHLGSESDSMITERFKDEVDRVSAYSKVSFRSKANKEKSINDLKTSHLVTEHF